MADNEDGNTLQLLQDRISSLETKKQSDPWMKELKAFQKMISDSSIPNREKRAAQQYTKVKQENGILRQNVRSLTTQVETLQRQNEVLERKCTQLEGLSRALSKQRLEIEENAQRLIEEEQTKRAEISSRFEASISSITNQLHEREQEQIQRDGHYKEMQNKVKEYLKQAEAREQQLSKIMQTKDLERELAEAKLKQALSQNNEIVEHLDTQQKAIAEYKKYTEQLVAESENLKRKNADQRKHLENQKAELRKFYKLEKEIKGWRTGFAKLEKSYSTHADEQKKLIELNSSLRAQLEEMKMASNERDVLRVENTRLNKQIDALRGSVYAIQAQRDEIQKRLDELIVPGSCDLDSKEGVAPASIASKTKSRDELTEDSSEQASIEQFMVDPDEIVQKPSSHRDNTLDIDKGAGAQTEEISGAEIKYEQPKDTSEQALTESLAVDSDDNGQHLPE